MRTGAFVCVTVAVALAAGPPVRGPVADRVARLIDQLGDDDFERREAASKELVALGKPALRPLRTAMTASDLEVRQRAERAVAAILVRLPHLQQKAETVHHFAWPGTPVSTTTVSPDGRHFLAGGDCGTLRLYEVKTGRQVQEFDGHERWVSHAAFLPGGKQVLSSSWDRTLRLWDRATGKQVAQFAIPYDVALVDVTRDGKRALLGSGDGVLRLWEVATGKEVRRFEGHTGPCMAVFTRDDRQILSGAGDRTLRLWDVASGEVLRTFRGHTADVYGVFLLPGGERALSYGVDETVRVWDLATGQQLRKIEVGPYPTGFRGLALAPDGQRLIVGNEGGSMVRVIELPNGKESHRFALAAPPRGLSFSGDGRLAVSGSWSGHVYLWRVPGIFED